MLQLSKFMQNPPSSTQNSYVDNSSLLLLIQVENNNILIIICREEKNKRFSEVHNQNYIASFFDNNKLFVGLSAALYTLSHLENDRDVRAWYRIRRLLSHTNFCIFTRAHKWISDRHTKDAFCSVIHPLMRRVTSLSFSRWDEV